MVIADWAQLSPASLIRQETTMHGLASFKQSDTNILHPHLLTTLRNSLCPLITMGYHYVGFFVFLCISSDLS